MSEKAYTPRPLRTAVSDHVGGGTPPRQVPSYWKGNIPWASVKDFPEQAGVITDTQEHISLAGLNASASNVIPAGTPLVCTRMAVGRAAMPSVPIAINQDVKALFLAAGVSVAYLLKLLQFVQPRAEALAVGSTVKGIRIQDYLNIDVPIAETNAQPIIAAVLDTLDTAIHETEAIIAKLKAVKQGLLHDLLTRGIDANGELRPLPSEAPHLYKPSPLGRIPKEWEQAYLGAKVEFFGGYAFPERCQGQSEGEVPFFKVSDQSNPGNERDLRVANNYVSRELARKQGWKLLPEGGVAFAKVGAALLMNRRRLLAQDSLVDNNMMVATGGDEVHSTWLYWFLQTIDFGKIVQDGALPSVNQGQLGALPASFPKLEEQREIADRLNRLDGILDMEQICLEKSRQLKTALMDDLLTGRVRVTPLLQEAQHA
ncbi:restriction endonuclease subunit S [Pseudoxanthomonas suwonensis]|uniref:restriction endonuclease subunit S n=2 Tax=Pseudomonadota TaxID=1224 RepID=UPI0009DFE768|nr:restriction endonuclease subunit S [Pseudoxanthomonas suwonensis]